MTPDLITYGARAVYREACRRDRVAPKGERAKSAQDKRNALHAMLAAEQGREWKR